MNQEKLLSTAEASHLLGISEKELKDLVENGLLTAYQIGGMYLRFRKDHIVDFKRSRRLPAMQKNSSIFDSIKDFFYFNDFYIASALIAAFLLMIIIQNIS